jgi:hypothetical protein
MSRSSAAPRRRLASILNAAIFLTAAVVLAVAANVIALRPGLRVQFDATRTRAYSLSPQTRQMLKNLRGDWTIAMIMQESATDHALRRQVDEVLKRFAQTAPSLTVARIDPQQSSSLAEYERLLDRLRETYREQIGAYDRALDAGVKAYQEALLFAQQQLPMLAKIPARLAADDPRRETLQQQVNSLALQVEHADAVLQSIAQARQVDSARPIPDYDGARSVIAAVLSELQSEIEKLAGAMQSLVTETSIDAAVRQFSSQAQDEYRVVAQRLALVAGSLHNLPGLELSAIGARLQEAEAAIVIGPSRATVIPGPQLVPRSNLRLNKDGAVAFDQRFRGEQIIAAAIRSLLVERMPMVVFMHADEEPMLRRREQEIDLLGAGAILAAGRYVVKEWMVGTDERPRPQPNQAVVWVVVPSVKAGAETSQRDMQLMDLVRTLIAEGEPVLLSLYPSLAQRFRKDDPWKEIVAELGIAADTASVICESMRVSEDRTNVERSQRILSFPDEHAISSAVDGQLLMLTLPISLARAAESESKARTTELARVESAPNRWRERDWNLEASDLKADEDERFDQPLPVAMAIERPRPDEPARMQRAVVVGSGGWMLSFVSDVTFEIGGDRAALAHPGNHELLLASVAWLAGMDEFIAAGATSQQVARLTEITPAVRATWMWIALAGLPPAALGLGVVVWLARRS